MLFATRLPWFLAIAVVTQCLAYPYPLTYAPYPELYDDNTHLFGGFLAANKYVCSMVFIRNNGGFCSGVQISNYKIMTAAHCFYKKKKSDIRVYVGDRVRGRSRPAAINNVYYLRRYNGKLTHGYDIAIVDLLERRPTRCIVWPQYYPEVEPRDQDRLLVFGYGKVHANGEDTRNLKEGVLVLAEDGHTLRGQSRCRKQSDSDKNQVICAVSPGYPKDQAVGTCGGDSGGPLIKQYNGYNWVVGVNSYSQTKCSSNGNIDKFARVYANRKAIDDLIYKNITSEWTVLK